VNKTEWTIFLKVFWQD